MTRRYGTTIGLAVLAAVVSIPPLLVHAQGHTSRARREAVAERGRDFLFQQQQIRRARGVTRRVLRDRRAAPETKQQATDLDALLDRRAELLATLAARFKDFVAAHKAEIDELEELRQRARAIDERLSAARGDVVEASQGEIRALKESAARSAQLVEALQEAYRKDRRERHRR